MMPREYRARPEFTRAEKSAAWDWLRKVAIDDDSHHAQVAIVEWQAYYNALAEIASGRVTDARLLRLIAAAALKHGAPPISTTAGEADMTDDKIESEIQAKGLTAPRVTPADVEDAIASEHYFTAAEGVAGEASLRARMVVIAEHEAPPPSLGLLTICVLVLRNGFTVVGTSACASPENFDAKLGRKIARAKAVDQVWPLLGYALRGKLAA